MIPLVRRTITVTQGEFRAEREPDVVLSTILGSCVAVCLYDPQVGVGGMNHFLLPQGQDTPGGRSERYGVNAMEQLINALLRMGARRKSLVAKAFGAANMTERLSPIGDANATFTRDFLLAESIACVAESFGGVNARKVLFHPTTGTARQMIVPGDFDEPRKPVPAVLKPDITLF